MALNFQLPQHQLCIIYIKGKVKILRINFIYTIETSMDAYDIKLNLNLFFWVYMWDASSSLLVHTRFIQILNANQFAISLSLWGYFPKKKKRKGLFTYVHAFYSG